ncbi:uncharacterized protein LOC133806456 [Humulus lupulus]|uniref:uncharacterized protein LOC133806456 n=1 Tax=Humulus lupulus TaxID=3486 RepID=UPI002B408077|nr:uncharacterized protein LOC133806456 [Humulus lupulus]
MRPTCSHCQKLGHLKEKCYFIHCFPPGYGTRNVNNKPTIHQATACTSSSQEPGTQAAIQNLIALLSTQLQQASSSNTETQPVISNFSGNFVSLSHDYWVIDSGATHHVRCNLQFITSFSNHTIASYLTFLNGLRIQDTTQNKMLGIAKRIGHLYLLQQDKTPLRSCSYVNSKKSCNIGHTWHTQLGHPSMKVTNKLNKVSHFSASSNNNVPCHSYGCLAYACTLDSKRNKFNPRSRACIFIGYPPGMKAKHSPSISNNEDLPSVPTSTSNAQPLTTSKAGQPLVKPPHLKDYICEYSTAHPLTNFISYDKFCPYFRNATLAAHTLPEPSKYTQASKLHEWQLAMQNELVALIENEIWNIFSLPKGHNVIGNKWVYKIKYKSNGDVDRYNACLVAKGYAQQKGIDYFETFAPVAKFNTLKVFLALAAIKKLETTPIGHK